MDKQAAIELIDRYLEGKASAEEKEQFLHALEHDEKFINLFEEILKEQYDANVFETVPNKKLRSLIQSRLQKGIRQEAPKKKGRLVTFWRVAAAAVVLLVIGGLWFVVSRKPDAGSQKTEVARTNDVPAPSNSRAVITLADGSKVYLDSAGSGTIAQQNNVDVVRNASGEIVYDAKVREANADLQYNTLSNPRGSKVISLTLSDGTRVWLNSESSLKYPTQFVKNTREVEITGEAYFEVAHDKTKPFIVSKGETSITVLGTHFNVNAYDDEDEIKVTLLNAPSARSCATDAHATRSPTSSPCRSHSPARSSTTSRAARHDAVCHGRTPASICTTVRSGSRKTTSMG
jgi:ferric-dicitrate binding protein FerR (iron transport regulator)